MPQVQIIYTVGDEDGDDATTALFVPNTFSLAQYTEFGAGMASFIDAVLDGRVESAAMAFSVDISALSLNVIGASSDVEEIGAFKFTTVEGFPVKVNIPALDEGFVGVGSDDIDQSAPAVAAYLTAMETGIAVTGGTIAPCDVGESSIAVTNYSREKFRSSGRRS